jgi:hypothetical protein
MKPTPLSTMIDEWLRRLVADHDGMAAVIVATTIGSLMIEEGPHKGFKLSRLSELSGLSPGIVVGILHGLRRNRRLFFKRRGDLRDGVDHEYRFTIPTKMPERVERDRIWSKMEVKHN